MKDDSLNLLKKNKSDKHRFVRPTIAVLSFAGLIFAFIYHYFFEASSAAIFCVICALLALIPVFTIKDLEKNHRVIVNWCLFDYSFAIVMIMYSTGALNAPATPWLALIPLAASIMVETIDTILWSVYSLSIYLIFSALVLFDYNFPMEVPIERVSYLSAISNMGLAVVMILLGLSADRKRKEIINEKESLQQLNFNQSKLASLGELVASIAHEINNPLAVISGRADILKTRIKTGKTDHESMMKNIEMIQATVFRTTSIIKSLKKLAKNDNNSELELVSITEIIEDIVNISHQKLLQANINFNWSNEVPGETFIKGDYTQLSQVFVNLLTNAVDAVENNEDKIISIESYIEDDFIKIKVMDNGDGVPDYIRDRIFEPFYTTKEVGKGTGIGLSLSLRVLESHDSTLELSPHPSATVFMITIPITQNHREHLNEAC